MFPKGSQMQGSNLSAHVIPTRAPSSSMTSSTALDSQELQYRLQQCVRDKAQLEDRAVGYEQQLEAQNIEFERVKSDNKALKSALQESQQEIAYLQHEINDITKSTETNVETEQLREKLKSSEQKLFMLRNSMSLLQDQADQPEPSLNNLIGIITSIQADMNDFSGDITPGRDAEGELYAIKELSEELERVKSQVIPKGQFHAVVDQLMQAACSNDTLSHESNSSLYSKYQKVKEKYKQQMEELKQLKRKLIMLQTKNAKLKNSLNQAQDTLSEVMSKNHHTVMMESELESLRATKVFHEGEIARLTKSVDYWSTLHGHRKENRDASSEVARSNSRASTNSKFSTFDIEKGHKSNS